MKTIIFLFYFLPAVLGRQEGKEMILVSPAFENGGVIPSRYTCQGEDINPPLVIQNVPKQAKSLVLIVDDPDAPMGTWVHWVVFNLPPADRFIQPGELNVGIEGRNDFGKNQYGGPCPPRGRHRYFFKLYALDTVLTLTAPVTKEKVEKAMQGHIISQAVLVGLYEK